MTKICGFKLALIWEPKLLTGVGSILEKNHAHHPPSKPWYAPTPDRQKCGFETEETADWRYTPAQKHGTQKVAAWVDGSPFPIRYFISWYFQVPAVSFYLRNQLWPSSNPIHRQWNIFHPGGKTTWRNPQPLGDAFGHPASGAHMAVSGNNLDVLLDVLLKL